MKHVHHRMASWDMSSCTTLFRSGVQAYLNSEHYWRIFNCYPADQLYVDRATIYLDPDSQFELHQTNLWMSIVTCIHAGLDAQRTPWRCTPHE